jgi:hypothetical protein
LSETKKKKKTNHPTITYLALDVLAALGRKIFADTRRAWNEPIVGAVIEGRAADLAVCGGERVGRVEFMSKGETDNVIQR